MNEMLDLGLSGTTVDDVLIEYSVRVQLSDLSVIVVESPLTIQNRAGRAHFTPDSDSDRALQPIQLLVTRTIEAATVDHAGGLRVNFTDGSQLCVDADDAYEAWTVSRPDGRLIVCLPGGDLARWGPARGADP